MKRKKILKTFSFNRNKSDKWAIEEHKDLITCTYCERKIHIGRQGFFFTDQWGFLCNQCEPEVNKKRQLEIRFSLESSEEQQWWLKAACQVFCGRLNQDSYIVRLRAAEMWHEANMDNHMIPS